MKESKKSELSWILYDCANSAYSMSVTTALFPLYFGMFDPKNGMDIGYFNSIASLAIAFMSPFLGTIADYKDRKKRIFLFFFLLGIIFTALLAVVPFGKRKILAVFYLLTATGFSGANIFYDAFLVDIATEKNIDQISSKGFAYGYITSIIPFTLSIIIIFISGTEKLLGYQIGFLITSLWWGLLTIPFIKHVNQKYYIDEEAHIIKNSFLRLISTIKNIRYHKTVYIFLIAYFLYIDGVDTIIKMAVPYSQNILGPDKFNVFYLLGILLVIQIIAFPFALLYGKLASVFSAKRMIQVGISSYVLACIFAFNINSMSDIFFLGGIIGSAQGGIQALSRSYFAKIIPKNNSNEFFGFYNIFGKFATISGPFMMALTSDITGNSRYSILGIIPLFIAGFAVFSFLPKDTSKIKKHTEK